MTETNQTAPLDGDPEAAPPALSDEDMARIREMQLASEMRAVRLATGATDEPEEEAPAAEPAAPPQDAP